MLGHIFVYAHGGLARVHGQAEVLEHFLFAPFFTGEVGLLRIEGIVQPGCHI